MCTSKLCTLCEVCIVDYVADYNSLITLYQCPCQLCVIGSVLSSTVFSNVLMRVMSLLVDSLSSFLKSLKSEPSLNTPVVLRLVINPVNYLMS